MTLEIRNKKKLKNDLVGYQNIRQSQVIIQKLNKYKYTLSYQRPREVPGLRHIVEN